VAGELVEPTSVWETLQLNTDAGLSVKYHRRPALFDLL
jgi:hypothetical protein